MKGRILITALALVLALGGLIVINRVEAAKALPVEMEVVNSIGDSSAAQGLTVDYRVAAENCLRWYTRYDPAAGENESDFYMTYRKIMISTVCGLSATPYPGRSIPICWLWTAWIPFCPTCCGRRIPRRERNGATASALPRGCIPTTTTMPIPCGW